MAKDPPSGSSNVRPQRVGVLRRVLVATAWVLGGFIAAVIVAAALFVSLINVDGVHRYLLRLAQNKATSMLGVPVTLQNFSVDVPALRVDLYGLTIDGAAPYPTPPLVRVSHVEASVRIVSIFRREWYLNRVEIDRPVVWIVRGKNGESNLPVLPKATGTSNIDLFSLAIRHAALTHGEVYFNNRPQDLSARLVDLKMSAAYNPPANAYTGHLAYTDGRIQLGAVSPLIHSLDASFAYTPGKLFLKRTIITSGRSNIELTGDVTHFDRPEIRAQYDLTLDGEEMRHFVRRQWPPSGAIHAKGAVTYVRDPAKPALDTLTLAGNASSRALTISMRGRTVPIRNLSASYSAAAGEVKLRQFRANVLGGSIAMEGTDKLNGDRQGGVATVKLNGISLGAAEQVFQLVSPEPLALSGTLNGNAVGRWGPNFKNLRAKLDASANGQMIPKVQGGVEDRQSGGGVANRTSLTDASIPLHADIHALYTLQNNRLKLEHTLFQTQATQLALDGTLGATSKLAVDFKTDELGSLAALSGLFMNRQSAERLRSLSLAGEASFHGQVAGSIAAPHLSGDFTASNVTIGETRWRTLHAYLEISPSLVNVERAYLAPAPQGSIRFNARIDLTHWVFSRDSMVDAAVTISRIETSDIMQMAGRAFPVSGILNAEIKVRGSVARPSGSGKIELTRAIAYRQPVKSAVLAFSTSDGEIRGTSTLAIAGGTVIASATVNPIYRTYSGTIHSRGIDIERLRFPSLRNRKAAGTLRIDADGHGSFDNPELNAEIQIPNGSVEGHSIPGMNLELNLSNHIVNASLSSAFDRAPVTGSARVALTGNDPADLSLDTGTFRLQPILALYAPDASERIKGQTQIHLQLHGPIGNPQAMTGEVVIPLLELTYNNVATLAAAAPIHIGYRNGVLRLNPATIRGTDADLKIEGNVPIFGKAPMSLDVLGRVNLELAQAFYPGLRASGTARIDIHSGTAFPGQMGGQIEIANASLASSSFPMGLQNGNGLLSLSGNRVDITRFVGTIGGGSVTAQGGISLRPELKFDLGMKASNVRMLYPQGMRESLNANLRLTGSSQQAMLGGTVGISDVSFTPGFDLISMAGQFSSGVSAPAAPGFSQNLALNIAVHSTDVLSPTSRTMSVTGTAALSVRGTAAHPALIGRVDLTGGSMIFHGNRFVLTSGTVQFVNPNQIRPILNLSLTTTIQQYDIDLRFTGPADQMRGEYTSNPSLPRADIISLLAFGTTTEAQAKNPTPANQLIASQVSSQVTSRISKIAGISQLSISPVLTSGTAAGPPGAVITIRQQVTGNLFITFSTNVASAQGQTIQGQYRLSPRVSVSATRDPNGGFAIDALIKRSW